MVKINEDFTVGQFSEDIVNTLSIKSYFYFDDNSKNDDQIIMPTPEQIIMPDFNKGFALKGSDLLTSLCDLYEFIKDNKIKDDNLSITIIKWCQDNIHPYYNYLITNEELERMADEKYWSDFRIPRVKYAFSRNQFYNDLKLLYQITIILIFFNRILNGGDIKECFEKIEKKEKFEFLIDKNTSNAIKVQKINEFVNSINKVNMTLMVGENYSFNLVPGFKSVFDAAYFMLFNLISIPPDVETKKSTIKLGFCKNCGSIFYKRNDNISYCKKEECRKRRDSDKALRNYNKNKNDANPNHIVKRYIKKDNISYSDNMLIFIEVLKNNITKGKPNNIENIKKYYLRVLNKMIDENKK